MGKSCALAWHHNLQDLMLEASCRISTDCRNPEEIDEDLVSASSNDTSSYGVLMESRQFSKSLTAWSKKE